MDNPQNDAMYWQDDTVRILICGSRMWNDGHMIADEASRLRARYGDNLTILHGDAMGADEWARRVCEDLQIRHIIYCAAKPKYASGRLRRVVQVSDWDKDGKRAGMLRNVAMADNGPIGCVAFRSEGKSNGTDNMIELCAERGIPRIVYLEDGRRMVGT